MTETTRRNRLVEIDRSKTTPEQEAVIERLGEGRGRIPTPYKVWLHSARLADGMEVIGTYLNSGAHLTNAEFEIATLATAVFWRSPYVVTNHARHAVQAGVPEQAVEAILAGRRPVVASERLQTVSDFAADLLAGGSIEDDRFDAYEKVLGREGIAELIVLVGYYSTVSIGMRVHEVPARG
ncbi:Carboxymuconolactone decarboxylase [Rhizobium sp. CF080]|uniref:carboxymuconolactone decarboxylase family protein n=1 Tax=Rhizobium sp. (strain CF080) TaxID=1144310 RepID=UPI000271D631|nr:carboxymuconolactone decarboxylase family protein [Rhizobium sp. CF080]EUB95446.1 Carboxymuconolactone decarboxylase [Rhizobium sp. CF080]